MLGICNGFQALVKLGLVPYGEIVDATPDAPTLTFNTIGRHQSRLVRTRVCVQPVPVASRCSRTTFTPSPLATARAALSPRRRARPAHRTARSPRSTWAGRHARNGSSIQPQRLDLCHRGYHLERPMAVSSARWGTPTRWRVLFCFAHTGRTPWKAASRISPPYPDSSWAALFVARSGVGFPLHQIWATALLGIPAHDSASQLLFAGLRFTLAGMLVIVGMSVAQRRPLVPQARDIKPIFSLSLFQTIGQYFFFIWDSRAPAPCRAPSSRPAPTSSQSSLPPWRFAPKSSMWPRCLAVCWALPVSRSSTFRARVAPLASGSMARALS